MAREIDPSDFIDQSTKGIEDMLGDTPPVRHLRKSQVLSGFLGALGFALFVDGIVKISKPLSGYAALLFGLLFMALAGLLLKKLYD